ncbi:MAG: hypothetical protein RJB04_169, partial [Verrucomicrobiota bacterium]
MVLGFCGWVFGAESFDPALESHRLTEESQFKEALNFSIERLSSVFRVGTCDDHPRPQYPGPLQLFIASGSASVDGPRGHCR